MSASGLVARRGGAAGGAACGSARVARALSPRVGITLTVCTGFAAAGAAAVALLLMPVGARGATLPDGRVYEQVTPVDKGGAELLTSSADPVAVGADGNSLLWGTLVNALPTSSSTPTAPNFVQPYVFTRDASGWSYRVALPPDNLVAYRLGQADTVLGVSADLTTSIAASFFGLTDGHDGLTGTPAQTGSNNSIIPNDVSYNVDTGATTVLTPPVPSDQTATYTASYVSDSAAADHVVFAANASLPVSNGLVPNPGLNPFLFDYTAGSLLQVALETDDTTPFPEGAVAPSIPGVVSNDGSEIFFAADASGTNSNQLFVRANDAGSDPQTLPVSVSGRTPADPSCTLYQNGGAAATAPATFEGATPSGSLAFFLSDCELTDVSHTGTSDASPDLYEYDATSHSVSDLSIDAGADSSTGADVLGVVGYSSDGAYVYFVARGLLDGSGAPSGDDQAPNLYLYHAGAVRYLATLNSADRGAWTPGSTLVPGGSQYAAAQVSPDGQYLLIASAQAFTAYANHGDKELYEFSAAGGPPICVSCDPSGAVPKGSATITLNSLSDSGQVFFQTPDPLLPADTNDVSDVYEWEATTQPSATPDPYGGGTISLLSAGSATISAAAGALPSVGSTLIAASPSGDDVFFVTRDQLAGQDQDDLSDIYDARVDGTPAPGAPASDLPACALALDGSCAPRSLPPALPSASVDAAGTNVTTPTTTTPVARAVTASLKAITAKQRSAFATRGVVTLGVMVTGATTLSATATAKLGRRTVTVARTTRTSKMAGVLTLSLPLSQAARNLLARHQVLRLTIKVTVSRGATYTTTLTLKR